MHHPSSLYRYIRKPWSLQSPSGVKQLIFFWTSPATWIVSSTSTVPLEISCNMYSPCIKIIVIDFLFFQRSQFLYCLHLHPPLLATNEICIHSAFHFTTVHCRYSIPLTKLERLIHHMCRSNHDPPSRPLLIQLETSTHRVFSKFTTSYTITYSNYWI